MVEYLNIKKINSQYLLFIFFLFNSNIFSQNNKTEHTPSFANFTTPFLCYGSPINFLNTTLANGPTSYTWTIYEQGISTPILTSTSFNISFVFPDKNTYTVTLDSYNGHGNTASRVFVMDSMIHAGFTYEYCRGLFSNESTCATSYLWQFGDGQTSTLKEPTYYYATTGYYTPTLTATSGTLTAVMTDTIFAYQNDLTGIFFSTVEKDSVLFLAADSLVSNSEYHWSFGDGNYADILNSNGKKIRHAYKKTGRDTTYTVFLLYKTPCFSKFSQGSVFIHDTTLVSGTSIYPNPVGNLLRIVSERKKEITEIKLFNTLGQPMSGYGLIEKQTGYDIDLSSLPSGAYILKLYFGDEFITQKIIRQ